MRRCATLALVVFFALPVAGLAGPGKPTFHERETNTFTDPNFCGTGEAVVISDAFKAIVRIGETGGDPEQDLKVTFTSQTTFTAENGNVLTAHSAGLFLNEIIAGLESGPHTHEFVERGVRSQLKVPGGGVLVIDAGSLTHRISFDANDEVTAFEIVSVHGPHPQFDGDVFCEVATEALGL
jgi:hypothetical protein